RSWRLSSSCACSRCRNGRRDVRRLTTQARERCALMVRSRAPAWRLEPWRRVIFPRNRLLIRSAASQILQTAVAQSIDPAMNRERLAAFPGARHDRGMADRLHLRPNVELAHPVDPRFFVGERRKLIMVIPAELAHRRE